MSALGGVIVVHRMHRALADLRATQSLSVLGALIAAHYAQPWKLALNSFALSTWLRGGMSINACRLNTIRDIGVRYFRWACMRSTLTRCRAPWACASSTG